MSNIVDFPYFYVADPTKGRPVFNGSVYIGVPDLDPTILANQLPISVRQEDGTEVSVNQPVATNAGGTLTYLGSPVQIVVDGAYSMAVLNSQDSQVYYVASVGGSADLAGTDLRYAPTFATVAAVTAATPLSLDGVEVAFTVGMVVGIVDYATGNNSGFMIGSVVAAATGTEDGGSFIDLANGLQWKQNFQKRISFKQFGSVGNGVFVESPSWNAACLYGQSIGGATLYAPPGTYFQDATITTYSNVTLEGAGGTSCVIKRTGSYGDTITQNTGFCKISGFFMQHGTNDPAGPTLDFQLSDGSAHIRLVDTQDAEITSNTIWRMPYGVVNQGAINSKITSNWIQGIWDKTLPAMQEGIADLWFINSAQHGQLAKVKNNYFSGSPGPTRNTTYTDGVTSVVKNYVSNVGSTNSIRANVIEDLEISGNYFGRSSFPLINLAPSGILNNVRIIGNFFDNTGDGTSSSQIQALATASGNQVLGLSIVGNTFNGEYDTNIGVDMLESPAPLLPTVVNFQITGNSFFAHTASPVVLLGGKEGVVSGNSFQNWNAVQAALLSGTNQAFRSAVFVGGVSKYISVTGNIMGGGGNDAGDVSNFCYAGVTLDPVSAFNSSNSNVFSGLTDDVNFYRGTTSVESQFLHTVEANYPMTQFQDMYIRNFVATAANLIQLPPFPITGREVIIKDGQGDAGTWALIINTADGTTIDGVAGPNINTNYGFMIFRFNGIEWNRIS